MNSKKGITLVALVITVIIMLVLVVIAIGQVNRYKIIGEAQDAVFISDYQSVKESLRLYKLENKIEESITKEEFENEDLIGIVAKKVIVNDTYRELAIIVDFNKINSKPAYGKGGIKLLEEDNNDKNSVKRIETIYDLEDVYAIDLQDGVFYYINENNIYTLETNKIEVEENGIKLKKYPVETYGKKHSYKKRFITKWDVTLGGTEESETYSTVTLPISKDSIYDATIYWGDGTSTVIQHKVNNKTLTTTELKEKATHNYTLEKKDNTIRTIEIEGTYTNFLVGNTETKLKLIEIQQWGDVNLGKVFFQGCSNLSGMIPKNDLTELQSTSYCFAQTSITGLEEGFCFSGGDFVQMFRYCAKLEKIPSSFKIPEGTTSLSDMFRGCSSLETLPDNFRIPNSVTSLYETFYQCSSLKEIPDTFKLSENITSVTSLFAGCSNLSKIPDDFRLPKGITGAGVANLFNGCGKLTKIPDDFVLPEGITSIQGLFGGCGIKKLPSNFKIPYGVTNMINSFMGCVFESFPENFEIPETVTTMYNAFRGCGKLKGTITIKANPSDYTHCFAYGTSQSSGSTLTINYSKNCTNIDEILATGNSKFIKKGIQID